MSANIAKRALEIVEQALDLPASEQAAFVEQACGDHAQLRREVDSMLAFDSGVMIEEPEVAEDPDEFPIESADSQRYEIRDELGRGGMGTVYRALDHHLDREVAIKVVHDGHASGNARGRFALEAQIGARLQHPGIAPVYDLGRLPDGRPFFAMKLVGGTTLGSLLAARDDVKDDLPHLLTVFEQLCQTIAYAHAHGIIHRDVKPDNVMIGDFGEVQVMDWGLAKVISDIGAGDEDEAHSSGASPQSSPARWSPSNSPETQAGIVMGTPAYMPPEQAAGQHGKPTDVFSLGAILCEILTLAPPYTAESNADLFRKSTEADLVEANARLEQCGADTELVDLAKDCLLPSAADRPRDGGEVASRVSAHLRAVESRLREAEMATARSEAKAVEERKRRRVTVMWLAAVLVLVTIILGGWVLIAQRNARRVREEAIRQAEIAQQLNEAKTEAIRLYQVARDAPLDDLSAWQSARIAMDQTQSLLEANDVSGELAEEITQLARDFAQKESDRKLLAAIERAREEATQEITVAGKEIEPRVRRREKLDTVLRDTPLHPSAPRNGAIGFLRSKTPPVREALIGALDQWMTACDSKAERQWWVEVVRGVDENVWRNSWRKALVDGDFAALTQLLRGEETLAQTPRSVLNICDAVEAADPGFNTKPILLQIYPRNAGDFWLNYSLADKWREETENEKAFRHFAVCLGMRPIGSLYRNIGDLHVIDSQHEEAIYCLKRAIEFNDQSGESWEALASAYVRTGRFEEAKSAFERAKELKGDNLKQVNQYANMLDRLGETDKAIDYLWDRLFSGNANMELWFRRQWLMILLIKEQRYLDAVRVFRHPMQLREDYDYQLHIKAALSAIQAADGKGKGAAELTSAERQELRHSAHEWFQEALAAWLARRPAAESVLRRIQYHRNGGVLDSVYQPDAISELPAAEQVAWRRFWFNVSEAERQLTYRDPALSDLSKWTAIDPVSIVSEAGAVFEQLPDGSFLVSGPHEARDVYSIRAELDVRWITAIRLDLVADERLPGKGPGRHASGNFHLAEISLQVPDETSDSGLREVPFANALATYSWPGRPLKNAIDGNPDSVWHIWSKQGTSHAAIFFLRDPITAAEAKQLTIRLVHGGDEALAIGRFRLSIQRAAQRHDDERSVPDEPVD